MTPSLFGCPNCKQVFRVRGIESGEVLSCPHCGQQVRIPPGFDSPRTNQQQVQEPIAAYDVRTPGSKPMPEKKPGDAETSPVASADPKALRSESVEKLRLSPKRKKLPPNKTARPDTAPGKVEISSEIPTDKELAQSAGASGPAAAEGEAVSGEAVSGEAVSGFVRDSGEASRDLSEPGEEPKEKGGAEQVADWLPPRFEVPDPSRLRDRDKTSQQVILPGSDGQLQTVDQRTVTIEYRGEKYRVLALSPAARQRRQFIINLISILLALLAIWITFRILVW